MSDLLLLMYFCPMICILPEGYFLVVFKYLFHEGWCDIKGKLTKIIEIISVCQNIDATLFNKINGDQQRYYLLTNKSKSALYQGITLDVL